MASIDEIFEEVPFYVSEEHNPKEFEKNLIENEVYVEAFCEKYGVELVGVEITMEAGYAEVAYTFSDEFGYYCIEGVKASLEEDESFYSRLFETVCSC